MNKNLIWFTGAPGSKWSGASNVIQSISKLDFNISDRTPDREYRHTGPTELARKIVHTGVYFGPGHGYGEKWDKFSDIDKLVVENEILNEWHDNSTGNFLVKSHFLSHHLDHIVKAWPDNVIIMIIRPSLRCEQGWFGAGGWDITYPKYRPFYKNDETMKLYIKDHNDKMIEFCDKHAISIEPFNREYIKRVFNWELADIIDPVYREWVDNHLTHIENSDDVRIAIYNIENLL